MAIVDERGKQKFQSPHPLQSTGYLAHLSPEASFISSLPTTPYNRKSCYINSKQMAQGGNNPEGIDENNWELLKTLASGVDGLADLLWESIGPR